MTTVGEGFKDYFPITVHGPERDGRVVKASVPRIISGIFRAGLTSQGFDNTGSTIRRGFRAGVKLYGLGVCCHVTITRSTKKITYVIMQALVVTIPNITTQSGCRTCALKTCRMPTTQQTPHRLNRCIIRCSTVPKS